MASDDTTNGVPDARLVENAVRNARAYGHGVWCTLRWVAVRDTFAVGSTTAAALCRRFGLDPDEEVSRG